MSILANLEPKEVFHYFEEICNIPHPSFKEEKISDYFVDFAKEHHLKVYQDEVKNIIMIKEASVGYENIDPIIIQGHMDMVCEKTPGYDIDFEKDGLKLVVDGDYISAEGTTLGGDDGIAVAYALAILASKSIAHPKLEVIFTVSEEVGMEGATAIDVSMLEGRKLLNLDSEEEGFLLTSCAGGCSSECILPTTWEEKTGTAIDIIVDGLKGGHSGVEIDKGRANANLLLGRILLETSKTIDYSIISLGGGSKDNAIPRHTTARIMLDSKDTEALTSVVSSIGQSISNEFSTSDPDIHVTTLNIGTVTTSVLTKETAKKAILLITQLPNGIQNMSADIKGLVETSLNLGVMSLTTERLSLRYAVRSSVKSSKEYLCTRLEALVTYFGGSMVRTGDYPAWEYMKESKLRQDMIDIYRKMYGKEPIIQAIHAGLECGILSNKLKGLDCISIGPDMSGVHTAQEKLSISSTKRVWEYILEVIKCK